MGYVKEAMLAVQEAGCLWVEEEVIDRLREAGHNPQTKMVVVEGYDGPVELDVLPAAEGLRLLPLADGDDYEVIADALSNFL